MSFLGLLGKIWAKQGRGNWWQSLYLYLSCQLLFEILILQFTVLGWVVGPKYNPVFFQLRTIAKKLVPGTLALFSRCFGFLRFFVGFDVANSIFLALNNFSKFECSSALLWDVEKCTVKFVCKNSAPLLKIGNQNLSLFCPPMTHNPLVTSSRYRFLRNDAELAKHWLFLGRTIWWL